MLHLFLNIIGIYLMIIILIAEYILLLTLCMFYLLLFVSGIFFLQYILLQIELRSTIFYVNGVSL